MDICGCVCHCIRVNLAQVFIFSFVISKCVHFKIISKCLIVCGFSCGRLYTYTMDSPGHSPVFSFFKLGFSHCALENSHPFE